MADRSSMRKTFEKLYGVGPISVVGLRCGKTYLAACVFAGDNEGLVIAEIEIGCEEEKFEKPDWLGEEVTHDHRYSNLNLAQHPYTKWGLNNDHAS